MNRSRNVRLNTSAHRKSETIRKTLAILRERFPESGALDMGTPFQMLVAVVLSARTKDEQVLKALPGLFAAYPDAARLAKGIPDDVGRHISSIGLYKSKAKYIIALAQKIRDEFDGEVPRTMGELVTLPGVGRKTASVLLAARFSMPAIAVDTHVFRIAQRLGWAKTASVSRLEEELLRRVPVDIQADVNTTMVPFGRAICIPRTPRCWMCPVVHLCAYPNKLLTPPPDAKDIQRKIEIQRKEIARLKEGATYAKH
jgi:endonuclease-3